MRSAIAFLLLLLCAVAVAPGRPVAHAPPRSSSTADAAQAIMPSVAVVRVEKRGHWGVVPVMGSGVVVAPGHILTCAHIVANSSKVAVELGVSKFEAKIIADDPALDLALLEFDAGKKCFRVATFAKELPEPGESVLAVGHPFGYTNTITTGVVSGVDREIAMPSGHTLKRIMQTSAPLNPGNSGGPLVNRDGEVVGITVAIRENAQGIGFAVPVPTIRHFLDQAK